MGWFNKILSFIIGLVVVGLFIAIASGKGGKVFNFEKENKECQKFYGKDYYYIRGDRSPDLCVTMDGKVRYFLLPSLIKND